MAEVKTAKFSQVHLLHDHFYTVPGSGAVIDLKAGEKFNLVKKVSGNWWSVARFGKDKELLYVPVCYVEEIPSSFQPDSSSSCIAGLSGKKDLPPKPPVKPKNLIGKRETSPVEADRLMPLITDQARIELFNILTSNSDTDYQSREEAEQKTVLIDRKVETPRNDDWTEMITPCPLQHVHKGSMQSLDMEFLDDNECMQMMHDDKELPENELNTGVEVIWKVELNEKGETVCLNQINGEKWVRLYDDHGRKYYFNDDTQDSQWFLPECDTTDSCKFMKEREQDEYQFSDKTGVLYKAKLSENGKKIKKSWSHSYVVLCGSMLYFHKENKTSSGKLNMSKPEAFVDLRMATIQKGNNVRSSRQNLIQLITSGSEYLLHHDDIDVIEEWFEALSKNISLLLKLMSTLKTSGSSQSFNDADILPVAAESPNIQKKNRQKTLKKVGEIGQVQEVDRTKLKEKLKFWLSRRPTKDSLRAKGIYEESIFGSHLLTICEKENSTIPKFVKDCIGAVETRGLTVDGIYRLSGNMAEIQKLRFTVNQNDDYDLLDPNLDIHVVTGSLKLFFRELLEPLFPFRVFHKLIEACKNQDQNLKSMEIKELIQMIPATNQDTMKELFRHLTLVIQHSRENRMQAQNIAIVFGPTLMWPDEADTSDLAVSLVQRGQLIEHMLQDYSSIFLLT